MQAIISVHPIYIQTDEEISMYKELYGTRAVQHLRLLLEALRLIIVPGLRLLLLMANPLFRRLPWWTTTPGRRPRGG